MRQYKNNKNANDVDVSNYVFPHYINNYFEFFDSKTECENNNAINIYKKLSIDENVRHDKWVDVNKDTPYKLFFTQSFNTCGKKWSLFDTETLSALCIMDYKSKECAVQLRNIDNMSHQDKKDLLRDCQQYIINVFPNEIDSLEPTNTGLYIVPDDKYNEDIGFVKQKNVLLAF